MLDALRDQRLVVFAGAGVSMGAPSGLQSFKALTKELAQDAHRLWDEADPPADRLLGELQQAGARAAERRAAAVCAA